MIDSTTPGPAGRSTRFSPDSLRWMILAVASMAQLMLILDTTIVSIALPSLQADLGMSDANRQWVITAYTLAFGGLLLLGGRVSSYFGPRNALIIGMVGFAGASALGGAANSQELLILSRALQGAFGAIIAPTALSTLTTTFTEPRERAKAFGIFGALSAGGAAIGLLSGGLLTEYLDWRWCFYVNIPIALIAIAGALWLMPAGRTFQINGRLDVLGAALGTGGLFALVYGFNRAEVNGWGDTSTIFWLATAAVVLTGFVFSQTRTAHPILPLRLLTNRNRAAAYSASLLAPFSLFGMFFFLTYYMQVVRDFSPVQTGLAFLPQTAAIIVGSQIAVRIMNRVSPRVPIGIGFGLIVAALLMMTQMQVDSTYAAFVLPVLLVSGVGVALIFPTAMNTAMRGIKAEDAGVAGAVLNTSQQIGASIGTSLLSTLAASATASYLIDHEGASLEAMVHGFNSATAWAAGIVTVVAIAVCLTMTGRRSEPVTESAEAAVMVHA